MIDDEYLGFQELMDVTEDGVFLDQEHTFNHFREICSPRTFTRAPREIWQQEGGKDLVASAREAYRVLREKHHPVNHPEEVLKAIEAIVARADKELAG